MKTQHDIEAASPAVVAPASSNQFKVITGRPMPDFTSNARSKYPFDGMVVGSCFLAGCDDKANRGRLYSAIANRKKKDRPGQKGADYKLHRAENGGVEVWRIA